MRARIGEGVGLLMREEFLTQLMDEALEIVRESS